MKEITKKLRSLDLFLSAHPDNEPDSEFADRISDLQELPELIKEYAREALENAAENATMEPNGMLLQVDKESILSDENLPEL